MKIGDKSLKKNSEKDELRQMLDDFMTEAKILKESPVVVSLKEQKIMAYIDKNEENKEKFTAKKIMLKKNNEGNLYVESVK